MPIPFSPKTKPASIIFPDRNGFLNIKNGDGFKLSCIGNEFLWPYKMSKTELTVVCLNETFVLYRSKKYLFEQFKCKQRPSPKFVVTSKKCQGSNNTFVARVGYQTRRSFLNLYRICFDNRSKNSLYSWYQVETPKCYRYQTTNWSGVLTKKFIETNSYDNTSISTLYNKQVSTLN